MSLSDDELKNAAQEALADGPEVMGTYRHYKGGIYVVLAVSLKEDTLEPMVTYRSNAKGTCWTRTLANWNEEVEVGIGGGDLTGLVPRFKRVSE